MKPIMKIAEELYNLMNGNPEENLNLSSVAKILFIALGGIGDMIMKTPAMMNLRKAFPEAYIAVLTNTSPASEVLVNCPYIDKLVFLGEEKPRYKQNPLKLVRLVFSLRREDFDMVITD